MTGRIGFLAGVLVLTLLAAAPLPLAGQATGQARPAVRVSTVGDLLRAIGPDRTVILASGEYDLSTARDVRSRYVSWRGTEAGDDYELVLTGVNGLTLRGEEGARIVTPPPYAYVLIIVDSRQVLLQNLGIGHREPGFCVGGVVRLEGCSVVALEGLDLWGSGVVGLDVSASEQVTLERSTIRECSSAAVWIDGSRDVRLQEVRIFANEVYSLISVTSSHGVSIRDSSITDNTGYVLLEVDEDSDPIDMPGTVVANNQIEQLAEEGYMRADLSGTVFRDNAFEPPTEGDDEEYFQDEYDGEYYEEEYYEEEYDEE